MSTKTCTEQSQCRAPILLRGGSPTDPCWTLGNVTAMETYFTYSNHSARVDSVVIDYGAVHCCPRGSSDPGITRKLRVQLLIVPDCTSGENWTVHHVPSIDVLKNCSLATNRTFQIRLGTSRLCPGNSHVLWKLSTLFSTLRCAKTTVAAGNQLQCQFHPVWASNVDMPVHSAGSVCQRLQVQVFYDYGKSQGTVTYKLGASLASPCSFTVPMTEYFVGVGVIDYDGSRLGEVFSAPARHRHAHTHANWSLASSGIFFLSIIIVIVICYRQITGGNADKHRSLLETAWRVRKQAHQIDREAPHSKQSQRD